MILHKLISTRAFEKAMFWQIVREWEDSICGELEIELQDQSTYCLGQKISWIDRVIYHEKLSFIDRFFGASRGNVGIHFWMNPPYHRGPLTSPQIIPLIIDCWQSELVRVAHFFRHHQAIFIASLEAVLALRREVGLPVYFLPVSLPLSSRLPGIPEKDIDILAYSRTHSDLLSWGKRFSMEASKVNYVHAFTRDGRSFILDRNGEREMPTDRAEILNLLQRSKVVLQSSPGLEPCNISRTGGFNPVTPRFLEAASCYCHMIGIFPDNPDFLEMKVTQICRRVHSYEEFTSAMLHALSNPFNAEKKAIYDAWLDENSTEARAAYVRKILSEF